MKIDGINDEEAKFRIVNYKIPLGSFPEEKLPKLFHITEKVLDHRMLYSDVLAENTGFQNPANVELLTEELGLSNITGNSSLFSSLQSKSGAILFCFLIRLFSAYLLCILGTMIH